jgi:hypothetical protein
MELNKDHRSALTERLIEIIEKKEQTKVLITKINDDFKHWREIDLFLIEAEQKTIEAALIQNEIDF